MYKEKIRPDLELNLLTILFPEMVYKSSDPIQSKLTNKALNFWRNKGYNVKLINLPDGIGDHLFEENKETPCAVCESVKNKIIFNELSNSFYNNSLVCLAHTVDDIVGYLSEIQLIAGSYGTWKELKQSNIDLFNRVAVLAKRVYPKYRPTNLQVIYIKPLIECEEYLLKKYVELKNLPLIPELCTEVRGPNFRMYKRTVIDGIKWLEKRYQKEPFYKKLLYKDYKSLINFYKNTGLLPTVHEIENIGLRSGI